MTKKREEEQDWPTEVAERPRRIAEGILAAAGSSAELQERYPFPEVRLAASQVLATLALAQEVHELRKFLQTSRLTVFVAEDSPVTEDEILALKKALGKKLRAPLCNKFSVRTTGVLRRNGIISFSQLVCRAGDELLSYRNLGETCLNEVIGVLTREGLSLRGESQSVTEHLKELLAIVGHGKVQ